MPMNAERNLRRTVLPNGLIVLTERMDHLRSVAMGVWVKSGSRCETAESNGISHFVEHMLFKGTRSRSAQNIAREMDSIGGNLDAFTSKETICFNVKSLSDHVPIALDVLTDMVLNPIFALPEIERERGVILEEIKIDEDNPDVLVHELFTQSFWKGHPLGKPILGTTETVGRLGQQQLFAYHGDRFHGGNMVFSAAGNLDHDRFVEAVAAKFSALDGGKTLNELSAPEASARIILRNKKALEQVQICLGVPAPPITDENRYATFDPEHSSGRRYEFAALPDHPRGTWPGLLCLLRLEPLSRHRKSVRVCGHFSEQSAGGGGPDSGRVPQPEGDTDRGRGIDPRQGPTEGQHSAGLESSNARMANLARQEMYFRQFFRPMRLSPAS